MAKTPQLLHSQHVATVLQDTDGKPMKKLVAVIGIWGHALHGEDQVRLQGAGFGTREHQPMPNIQPLAGASLGLIEFHLVIL